MFNLKKSQIAFINKFRNSMKENFAGNGQFYDFVFLCGKERQPNDNRFIIQKIISQTCMRESLYSEELFRYLSDIDLLSFEEILLDISVAVIIIVESYGSACELGAFSMVNTNLEKLFVINNKIHLEKESFINNGPIKKINNYNYNRKRNKKRVFFELFEADNNDRISISADLYNEIIGIEKKKNFCANPYSIEGDYVDIKDLSYLLWLVLDLIKVFGVIEVDSVYSIVLNFYNVREIRIKTEANNHITDQSIIKKIMLFLIKVLENFNLILTYDGNGYMNYSFMKSKGLNINRLTNILFKETDSKSLKFITEKSKLLNLLKKNGYNIWDY